MHPSRIQNRLPVCFPRDLLASFAMWLAGALLLAAIAGWSCEAAADDDQTLDQFLSRLGLTELRHTHLERMLAQETSPEKRTLLAVKLADSYAEELVVAADEPERF